jgi:hypothetical protein
MWAAIDVSGWKTLCRSISSKVKFGRSSGTRFSNIVFTLLWGLEIVITRLLIEYEIRQALRVTTCRYGQKYHRWLDDCERKIDGHLE